MCAGVGVDGGVPVSLAALPATAGQSSSSTVLTLSKWTPRKCSTWILIRHLSRVAPLAFHPTGRCCKAGSGWRRVPDAAELAKSDR